MRRVISFPSSQLIVGSNHIHKIPPERPLCMCVHTGYWGRGWNRRGGLDPWSPADALRDPRLLPRAAPRLAVASEGRAEGTGGLGPGAGVSSQALVRGKSPPRDGPHREASRGLTRRTRRSTRFAQSVFVLSRVLSSRGLASDAGSPQLAQVFFCAPVRVGFPRAYGREDAVGSFVTTRAVCNHRS